jgi:SAM-dependent methyltransferase/methyltransferase-like protein
MTDASGGASYDAIPYPSLAVTETHPDRLATLATLFGLPPPPVARCRLLELGCGDGANLLPLAAALPAATLVGIDRAARPIAAGQAAAAALGLANLTLTVCDVRALPADLGAFDYIVAHGLYAWAPADVQAAVLASCARHLAPGGVAYVSYAAYPGWHLFGVVRDLLRYYTRAIADPFERAATALALLDRLATSIPDERGAFGRLINFYAGFLKQRMDELGEARFAYILHDTLAEVHQPLYLHEFVARAAAHGLHYLTDADLSITLHGDAPPGAVAAARALGAGVIEQEQALDFFRGRAFHRTLLCHATAPVERAPAPERVYGLFVSSPARPVAATVDLHGPAAAEFRVAGTDEPLRLDRPLSKAALLVLGEQWPRALPFDALLAAARARLGRPAAGDGEERLLADDLLRAYCRSARLVGLHVEPPRPAVAAGARPIASAVARREARFRAEVTNLYHQTVTLDGFRHCLLGLLDGSRDRAALLAALAELAADGRLTLTRGGAPVREPAAVAALLAELLEPSLDWLARQALLAPEER